MSEHDLEQALAGILDEASVTEPDDEMTATIPVELTGVRDVASYRDAGVLTNNAGLVVLMKDGSEFQITIVQSR